MQTWFPDPFNADTWNFNAINPWVTNFNIGIHKGRRTPDRLNLAGAWVQDDWRLSNKVTLNLGLRWDIQTNAFANDGEVRALHGARAVRTTGTTLRRESASPTR